jgi:hypothetical protein
VKGVAGFVLGDLFCYPCLPAYHWESKLCIEAVTGGLRFVTPYP